MILLHKDTHEMVPAPPLLTHFLTAESKVSLLEELKNPSFAERAAAGSRELKNIFTDPVRKLGAHIANSPRETAYPKIIDETQHEYAL
jgi:hypothetical protein